MILEQKIGKTENLHLHKNILNILFENKKYLQNLFSNVIGLYDVSYVSISIINQNGEFVVFSSMPSIQYNLIVKELWLHDCQRIMRKKERKLLWWDESHHVDLKNQQITNIKEVKNRFNLGLDILRDSGDFTVIYSFATANKAKNMKEYYLVHQENLVAIGNYCYTLLREIYRGYYPDCELPKIGLYEPLKKSVAYIPYLKLVVSN